MKEELRSRGRALRGRLAVLGALVLSLVAAPSVAMAQTTAPVDPLNGAGSGLFDTLKGYLTGSLVPAVIALAVVGMAIGLLIKWGKKAKNSA